MTAPQIHIGTHYIIGAPTFTKPRRVVHRLEGLKLAIATGWGPEILDKLILTPLAAVYYKEYKATAFENVSDKSYPLD